MSSSKLDKSLELVANDLTYLPSAEQRKAKSAFWVRWADNPICDARDITLDIAQQLVAEPRLARWWGAEGFREWFRNQEEFRERAEFLAHLAMDALQEVLMTDDPKAASARINAVKVALEIARKMPSKGQLEKYADQRISEMTREELEKYISRTTTRLLPTTE